MDRATNNQTIKQQRENPVRGELLMVAFAPHPPIMIPEVGRGEDQKVEQSQKAMYRLRADLQAVQPDTFIFITPHGPVFQDGLALYGTSVLKGDLSQFGVSQVSFSYPNDLELAQVIGEEARKDGILTVLLDELQADYYGVSTRLDHGVQVPLYFLQGNGQLATSGENPVKMVVMAYGLLPFEDLYAFGIALRKAVERTGRRAVLIASGDLSHRLIPGSPSGYRVEGPVFDRRIREIIAQADVPGLFTLPPGLAEQAGECGLRSLVIAWGAVDGYQVNPKVYSYEGPFGVGYLVANLGIGQPDPARQLLAQLKERRQRYMQECREKESPLVCLARESLETYVREGRRPAVIEPLPEEMRFPAGAFVSIKKRGRLRGCIGTITPTQPRLAQEIIENAISAGCRDPRFNPVDESELGDLVYSVDVMGEPETITSIEELDPARYGVIVSHGSRRGLLLPDLEGIETPEEQVAIARQKAGIGPDEPVKLERFTVHRYT